MPSFFIVGYTDFREGVPFCPPTPHPWAASKKPILNRVNVHAKLCISKQSSSIWLFDYISQKLEIIMVYLSRFSFVLFENYSKIISTLLNQGSLMTHNIVLFKVFLVYFWKLFYKWVLEVLDLQVTFAPIFKGIINKR